MRPMLALHDYQSRVNTRKTNPNATRLTLPEREPPFRGMLDQIRHSLPNTSFNWRQLEGGSRVVIIQICADEVSRLINILALVKDGSTRVEAIGAGPGSWKILGRSTTSMVAGVIASRT